MRRQTVKLLKILAIFVVLISVVLFSSRHNSNFFRIRIVDASSFVLKPLSALIKLPGKIMPFASLRAENKLLREKVAYLVAKYGEARAVYEENHRLKAILNFRQQVPYKTIPAQVIGRDASNWSNSIIIDKGLNFGISKNKAALSLQGLVGRVVEVGRYSSKILLVTDPDSKVGVLILRNRQGGILIGRPGGSCKMVYIALDSDVAPGDKVITAGFGGVFPKDVLVGSVVKVAKEPGRLYKYAIVKPAQDLSRLEEVLCIK